MNETSVPTPVSESPTGLIVAPASPAQKALRKAAWIATAFFFLFTFTLLKLPEDRVRNYVQGSIAAALATKGIGFTAGKSGISIGLGLSYVMKDVTLSPPPPEAPVHIDEIAVAPSILPLILGKMGGKLWLYNGDGKLSASFGMRHSSFSGSFKIKNLDLGKLGLLPMLAGVKASGQLSGDGSVSGDMTAPATLAGDVDLDLSKVAIDQQSVMGFSIPRLGISQGKVELAADKGKVTIKTLKLGKPGNPSDDIRATVTGDVTLGKQWESSTLNLKANFGLSETVLRSFVLIDALLGAGKQGDGTYSFNITGPAYAPNPTPAGVGAPAH